MSLGDQSVVLQRAQGKGQGTCPTLEGGDHATNGGFDDILGNVGLGQ